MNYFQMERIELQSDVAQKSDHVSLPDPHNPYLRFTVTPYLCHRFLAVCTLVKNCQG